MEGRQGEELKAEAKAEVIVNQRQKERDCGSCRGRGDYGGEAERQKQRGRGLIKPALPAGKPCKSGHQPPTTCHQSHKKSLCCCVCRELS